MKKKKKKKPAFSANILGMHSKAVANFEYEY